MAKSISQADVVHVAQLARLELSQEELDLYTGQLGEILDAFSAMTDIDTSGIPPTLHPLPLQNVLRDDVERPGLDRAEVLSQAPSVEDGRFRVPRLLDDR